MFGNRRKIKKAEKELEMANFEMQYRDYMLKKKQAEGYPMKNEPAELGKAADKVMKAQDELNRLKDRKIFK